MGLPQIIQVEVTTSCQARCTFCPRTQLKDKWVSGHIAWEDFTGILPVVRWGSLVHLQGWGEPLLHPRLWDMAAAVRQKKGSVSLTTNGGLMDRAVSRELCRLGFTFVAISLAGDAADLHGLLRPGPALDRISSNIEYLSVLKGRPGIHIAVQMMKPNLERLPEVVELAARLGADRVIASNLDCITSPETDALRAFGDARDPHAEEIVEAARRTGKERNIEVEIYPLHLQYNVPVCRADPLHTAVVTSAGEIAPCVYVQLPLLGDIPRIFHGKRETVRQFSYGKISGGFRQVMKDENSRDFLGAFERRVQAAVMGDAKKFALLAMPGLRSIREEALRKADEPPQLEGNSALPAAPGPCRYCYKLYGI